MFSIANLCDQDLNLRRRYVLILLRAIVSYCSCRLSGHAPTPTPTLGGGGEVKVSEKSLLWGRDGGGQKFLFWGGELILLGGGYVILK